MHLPIRYPNLGANLPSQPLPTHHAVNQHMMHGNEGERTVHQGQGEAKGGLTGRLTICALLLTHLARCMFILSILLHRACPEAKSGSLFFSRSSQSCGLLIVPTLYLPIAVWTGDRCVQRNTLQLPCEGRRPDMCRCAQMQTDCARCSTDSAD